MNVFALSLLVFIVVMVIYNAVLIVKETDTFLKLINLIILTIWVAALVSSVFLELLILQK